MDDRFHDIESPTKGTCELLLQHDMFKSRVPRDQSLSVKGKPGSRKSTLLQYAIENLEKTPSFRDRDLILSFFFHGRGRNELQKTPLGLFRSLLHQILIRFPDAVPNIVANFQRWRDFVSNPGQKYEWRLSELLRFIKSSLSKILKSHSVWLFVDALDEGGGDNAVCTFSHVRSMLQTSSSKDFQIRICYTCRHYPVLDTGNAPSIRLGNKNQEDILKYLLDQLSVSDELTKFKIPSPIAMRADGIFMWVRLVVKSVLKLESKRKGLNKIEKKISSVPVDLYKLYNELVQSTDEKSASLKLFQWICFARRPLTLDELRWAMLVDPDCQSQSLWDSKSTEEHVRGSKRMKGRVEVLSCGLAEITTMYGCAVYPPVSPRLVP